MFLQQDTPASRFRVCAGEAKTVPYEHGRRAYEWLAQLALDLLVNFGRPNPATREHDRLCVRSIDLARELQPTRGLRVADLPFGVEAERLRCHDREPQVREVRLQSSRHLGAIRGA